MLETSLVTQSLPLYGETILQCDVYITEGIHHHGNSSVLKYACALLNSGGGLLRLRNVEHLRHTQSKHLDTWWSGMENILTNIVSSDDICNYFDLVGNYDDPDLYLFVRAAEHLCTLDYHARLPTDTATHDVTHQSALKLLSAVSCGVAPGGIASLPPIPPEFCYRVTNPDLKQEGKRIQFKQLSAPKGYRSPENTSLPNKICKMMMKYVSAFGNYEGGRVYFGIEDNMAAVIGEEMSEAMQQQTVKKVTDRMACMIWGEVDQRPVRGLHWDIEFRPVLGRPRGMPHVVAIISISQFYGGVFMSCPESFYVNKEGEVTGLSYNHWRGLMLKATLDIPALHSKFMKVNMAVPNPRLVFTLPDSVQRIKDKLFQASRQPVLHPRHSLEALPDATVRHQLQLFLRALGADTEFLALCPHSWGVGLPHGDNLNIAATLLILGPSLGVHILVLGHRSVRDLQDSARRAGVYIKKGVTLDGACSEKFFTMCHAANVDTQAWWNSVVARMTTANQCLPSHFRMGPWKYERVLHSLVLWMAMYKSYATARDLPKHYFTLTLNQFELLWSQQYTRQLWVHGPAGSGKTLLAILLMRELRRRGCHKEEVLYLAENDRLCEYVGSFNLALTTCRRPFLADHDSPDDFGHLYGRVRNVIVDEAQNFKARDGDWYGIAEALVKRWANRNAAPDPTADSRAKCPRTETSGSADRKNGGHFWLFMDYAGKVHRFAAGLPGLMGENNFMLSEVTRSTGEIFDFARRFLDCDHSVAPPSVKQQQQQPHITHQLQGDKVKVIKCEEDSMKSVLLSVLSTIREQGVKLDDVAVLLGKHQDSVPLGEDLNHELQKETAGANVTVDSVKRFSGLERPVIIGLNLRVNEQNADFNKFMASLVTRATNDVVIITSKDLAAFQQ